MRIFRIIKAYQLVNYYLPIKKKMLDMLEESKKHVTNHIIIRSVFIEKVYKQLFLTKLIIGIILKGGQSHAKSYIEV